jgi:iron complex outermembrane recepter protein
VNITQELQQSYYAFAESGSPSTTNFGTTLLNRQFALGVRWKY